MFAGRTVGLSPSNALENPCLESRGINLFTMRSGERILLRLCFCFYLVWGKMLLTTVSITFCICCDVGCAKITCIVYSVLLYANSRCACSRCLDFAFFIFIPYLHNKSYCHFYGSCYETKGGGFRTQLGLVRNMSFFWFQEKCWNVIFSPSARLAQLCVPIVGRITLRHCRLMWW